MIYNLKYINDDNDVVEFSFESKIIIGSITGFTENFINLSLSQGINQVGSTMQGQAVQAKDIIVNGEIMGETIAARRLMVNTIKPLTGARLIYNDEWEIKVYPTQTPIIEKYRKNAKFQFILKAPFPYWNKIKTTAVPLSGIEPMFSFPWDLSTTFQFGKRVENYFTNVVNTGNVDAPFRIKFTATAELSNPKITNAETLEFFRIKRAMKVGETITVDIGSSGVSIISEFEGKKTDVFGSFDIYSDLYRLQVGDNILRYDADINRDGLEVIIYPSILTVGVYD